MECASLVELDVLSVAVLRLELEEVFSRNVELEDELEELLELLELTDDKVTEDVLLRKSELDVLKMNSVELELEVLSVDGLFVELLFTMRVELELDSVTGELDDSLRELGVTPEMLLVENLTLVELDEPELRSDSELELVENSRKEELVLFSRYVLELSELKVL